MPINIELLRSQLKAQRNTISAKNIEIASTKATTLLTEMPLYQQANSIAVYLAFGGEINTNGLINSALLNSKNIYLPVIGDKQSLYFAPYTKQCTLKLNQFGINEPICSANEYRPISAFEIVLMPLLGFDKQGNRIGMGAGYYDRALADTTFGKPVKIGFAYDWQCIDSLEPRPWDIPMDYIVTDQAIYSTTATCTPTEE